MSFKIWLLVTLYILINQHILSCAANESFKENIIDVNTTPAENVNKNIDESVNNSKNFDIRNVYDYELQNSTQKSIEDRKSNLEKDKANGKGNGRKISNDSDQVGEINNSPVIHGSPNGDHTLQVPHVGNLYAFEISKQDYKDDTKVSTKVVEPTVAPVELIAFHENNISNSLTKESGLAKQTGVADIKELYNLALTNSSLGGSSKQSSNSGNIAMLYDPNFPLDATITNNEFVDQSFSKQSQQSDVNNIAHLYNLGLPNASYNQSNKSQNPLSTTLATDGSVSKVSAAIESIAELYFFSSPIVMGMFNCTYENTINITDYPALANGSYLYDNHTIIPADLVGNYNYEILYDGSKRCVPLHKRACICKIRPCITLCSHNILEVYQDILNDKEADENFMNLFLIKTTLANRTVITRNIAKDFEHIVLEEFCEPFYILSPEKSDNLGWTLFENGTLLRESDQVQLKNTEYCFELYQDSFENEIYYLINPLNCAMEREHSLQLMLEFHYWTQVLSVPCFILTIIAYFCLPELRNVHGKCFMTYLSCVATSYGLLSYINLSQITFEPIPCLLMGYLNQYMQLAQYTWLAIICIDTWRSFSDYSYKASYYKYAMYGYHLPLLMTFLTFVAQNSPIREQLKPGITENRCGLEVNKWAALIYLYGPCLIILACCLVSFILTSRIIKAHNREVCKLNDLQFECPRVRYSLYLRLFLMMGLSWFLDIISYFLNMFKMKNISEIIDYINAMQGLYIFVNFILRKRVRNIIKERFFKRN